MKSPFFARLAVAAIPLALPLALSSPVHAAQSPAPLTDAREVAPDGLIGFWKADLAASSVPDHKPVVALRSFAYDVDGKVLVSFASRGADGTVTSGHWSAQIDGPPSVEYHSAAGALAYNVVSWKAAGEGRLALTVTRHGKVSIEAIYQLSPDRQTLTYSYGQTVYIYHRWNLGD